MLQKHVFSALLLFSAATAVCQTDLSYPSEKKVDYLEQLYFSGKNKAELTETIELQVQKIGSQFDTSQIPSPELLKQYIFLKNIIPRLEAAKDACDIEDILAVGIRNLDLEEAIAQKIKQPSDNAKKSASDALAGIDKLNNVVSTTSDAANSLAWTNYLLSGKAIGFGAGSKIAGVGSGLSAGAEVFGAVKSLGLLKGKDKPCKDVEKKDIAIGQHKVTPKVPVNTTAQADNIAIDVTANSGTTVTINNISFKQLSTVRDLMAKMKGVQNVTTEKFSNSVAVLKVLHDLDLDDLLVSITQLTSSVKLEVSASDAKTNSGVLMCKL